MTGFVSFERVDGVWSAHTSTEGPPAVDEAADQTIGIQIQTVVDAFEIEVRDADSRTVRRLECCDHRWTLVEGARQEWESKLLLAAGPFPDEVEPEVLEAWDEAVRTGDWEPVADFAFPTVTPGLEALAKHLGCSIRVVDLLGVRVVGPPWWKRLFG